jgi:hypothetical protein
MQEIMVECHWSEERDQTGNPVARVILFNVDPDNGAKSIGEIAEVEVIGPAAHCYNLTHLARVGAGWIEEQLVYTNTPQEVFGRATANATTLRKALVWHVEHFIKNKQTWFAEPDPVPPTFSERLISDAEWEIVQAMRRAYGVE